jgi:glycosyltransferase involved in cell wall biosynthesis
VRGEPGRLGGQVTDGDVSDPRSGPLIVFAHPSAELYGSDRMLLESVRALAADHRLVVTVPEDGPLLPLLRRAGAEVVVLPVPVLRKAALRRPLGLLLATLRALPGAVRLLRRLGPDLLYVNTIVLPLWVLAGRLARVRVLAHVHEAEDRLPGPLSKLLYLPVRPAHLVVANSRATAAAMGRAVRRSRIQVVHNGAGPPPGPIAALPQEPPAEPRLVLVGRLSANKGSDLAIKAVQLLRERGHKVRLTLVGDIYPGNEGFLAELRRLAAEPSAEPSAEGAVEFAGFRPEPWDSLAAADIALTPSRLESFGLVAAEAMMAGRPVVAAAVQGLAEVVEDGVTGVLVAPDDPVALADGIERLLDDWPAAVALARRARADAVGRFGKDRYYHELRQAVRRLSPAPQSDHRPPRDPRT